MNKYFVTSGYRSELSAVINKTFGSLISDHKNILLDYLTDIIDVIAVRFNFDLDKRDVYEQQFRQNNYKDAVGLLYLLLPFINENQNKNDIKSLNDLYIDKNNGDIDITKVAPKYKYSNLQYGRCKRNLPNSSSIEISFSKEHLEHNYILLLDTIKTISNKLYTNWINVRPVSDINNYYPYIVTNELIKNNAVKEWDIMDKESNTKYLNSMDASEMYNIISNYWFHEIVDIKWILYEIYLDERSFKTPYRFLDALHILFNIDEASKGISWDNLSSDNKEKVNQEWNNFISVFLKNEGYGVLRDSHVSYVMKTLIIFFDRNRRYHPDNYTKLDLKNINSISDIDDVIDNFDPDTELDPLKKTVKSLTNNAQNIYEYIRGCLLTLRTTFYSDYYLKYDGNKKQYNYDHDKTKIFVYDFITVKKLYNYAKSLISYSESNKYLQFPRFWKSLEDNDKSIIISRLNHNDNNTVLQWFNITRYLIGTVKMPSEMASRFNIDIHNKIKTGLSSFLYGTLVKMGLLTEFIPDFKLTDQNYLPSSAQDRTREIISKLGKYVLGNSEVRKNWDNSYYFLNGLEYKDMYYGEKKYLDALSEQSNEISGWITTYAMNWISQIGFFHHYLNNRIIYVTGSTGVGKSTQTPKLFLYALKMIDYKSNGKIVCTQPRIAPTRKNAQIISSELGVPIFDHKGKNNELLIDNYYVQFKYQGGSHEDRYHKGLSLLIMTDGTLEQQLKNPVLKTSYTINNKKFYTSENIYDIVIVDESHEHGKNMDLILTKMKHVSYYNNDVKLVIVSATMDDDEPFYRRYYRNINDNKMYPLNLFLQKNNLDRINVDRRIHISPPGETTQYKIVEIYKENANADDLVVEIANTMPDGDILLFKPGEKNIKDSRDYINSKTGSNVIALPFFSQMSDDKRGFVEGISKNKKLLDISKNSKFEEDNTNNPKVYPGTYTRVIVIATNIAEASITIPTLKYVVDTGTEKSSIFDYKTRLLTLNEISISESSRLQRKGRVGRTGPGTVFYTYREFDKKNNKIKYKISQENISDKLFEMLKSGDDEQLFFTDENDPNKISTFDYIFGLDAMAKKQYYTKSTFYAYEGNNNHYDYENNKRPYNYYVSGFDKKTLDDKDGSFYIIHPEELCFDRNILGNIVSVSKECTDVKLIDNKIESKKMQVFWEILTEYLLVVKDGDALYKTQLGEKLMELKTEINANVDIDFKHLISYIYSRAYGCGPDMIKLISMYMTIRSPKEIAAERQMENTMHLYKSGLGDSEALIKIANDVIKNKDNLVNLENFCKSHYLNYKNILSFLKYYDVLLNEINKLNLEWFNTHVPVLISNTGNKIAVSLLHGHSYNIVKNIANIKNNNYYINIFRPSIRNIFIIQKLYRVDYETKKLIPNNSFLKSIDMYSTLLYINQTENSITGDNELTFIENIPPNIISKIVPQILDDKNKYDPYYLKKEFETYMSTLGLKHHNDILNNYMKAVSDIKMDLYNNFDINIFEKLKIIDDRPKVKELIFNEFRRKKSDVLQDGGNRDIQKDSSFVQDIIDLTYSQDL